MQENSFKPYISLKSKYLPRERNLKSHLFTLQFINSLNLRFNKVINLPISRLPNYKITVYPFN